MEVAAAQGMFSRRDKQMKLKNNRKYLFSIVILIFIPLLFSSCGFNELRQFGLSVLLGTPIENENAEEITEGMIDNPNNYYIKDDESTEATFYYTVEKAYTINALSEAGLTVDDFFNSNEKTEYFTSDGKLRDSELRLICVELSVEKQSERRKSYTGAADESIHILEEMYLFSDNAQIPISKSYVGIYLNQTEDITKSPIENEYSYFSLKKGQTASFKLCFIINKTELENANICMDLGKCVFMNETNVDIKRCYIPLTIEGEKYPCD